jgi:hypothetical protein
MKGEVPQGPSIDEVDPSLVHVRMVHEGGDAVDAIESNPLPTRVEPPPVIPEGDTDLLIVSGEDAKQMLADVMNPPEPTEALRELMKGHRKA